MTELDEELLEVFGKDTSNMWLGRTCEETDEDFLMMCKQVVEKAGYSIQPKGGN